MLSTTERKCLDIRNRVYPPEERVSAIYERSILELGGPDRVLLEIGCGRAPQLLERLAAHYRLCIGIDLEIAAPAPREARWQVVRADGHNIPLPDASVDVVISQDVVEHLADPVRAFRECARVLRPGGTLVTLTVNKYFPPVLVARLLPHRVRQVVNRLASGTLEEDTFPAFYRANSRRALIDAVQAAGFRVRSCRYVTHHPRYFMLCVPLYRLAVAVERRVHRWPSAQPLLHYIHGIFERADAPVSAASRCDTAREAEVETGAESDAVADTQAAHVRPPAPERSLAAV